MNLSLGLVEPLDAAGYEVQHWSQVGDHGAPDSKIMEWAAQNEAVVITHDLDFSAILASTKGRSPSVIQIRTQDTLGEGFIAVLIVALQHFSEMLESGAIVSIDENGQRARALPLK